MEVTSLEAARAASFERASRCDTDPMTSRGGRIAVRSARGLFGAPLRTGARVVPSARARYRPLRGTDPPPRSVAPAISRRTARASPSRRRPCRPHIYCGATGVPGLEGGGGGQQLLQDREGCVHVALGGIQCFPERVIQETHWSVPAPSSQDCMSISRYIPAALV